MEEVKTIYQVVRELRQTYAVDDFMDLERIVKDHNIKVKQADLTAKGYSGYVARKADDTWEIVINSTQTTGRKRFTIAHELGHFFLHADRITKGKARIDQIDYIEKQNLDTEIDDYMHIEEVEANQFAAEVLMPESIVRRIAKSSYTINSDARRALADYFRVSPSAMYYRLKYLGYSQV